MSIRCQMALLLIALSTFFVATTWTMQTVFMAPAFSRLEHDAARKDVNRCVDAIRSDVDNLSSLANDWGAWDDTYRYVQGQNPSFRPTNLMDETFINTNADFICILDLSGKIVWADCYDAKSATHPDITNLMAHICDSESGFHIFRNNDDSVSGLLNTDHGPMMIASRPVIPTKRDGIIQGAVVMGRFLNEARIASLSERTHLQLKLWPVKSPDSIVAVVDGTGADGMWPGKLKPDQTQAAQFVAVSPSTMALAGPREVPQTVQEVDEILISGSAVINDVYERPAVAIEILIQRDISRQGRSAANAAMLCTLIGVISMNLGTGLALRLRVVEPLQNMAAHAARVGETDDLDARLQSTRGDEIGILARSFDCMVERLAESREKIQAAAHLAGMAEIASEVLHNVGNAVNTANCCVELVEDRLSSSRLSGLEMATLMLAEQASQAARFFSEDPRGPKLVTYLISLNDTLQRERCENLEELRRLQETIRHIRDAIASQQSHARRSDFRQRVNLLELLEESLLVNATLHQETGVRVEVTTPEVADVSINRSRVAQVLVNLERNALLSMQAVPRDDHQLTIIVSVTSPDILEFVIQDTGTGFSPEVHRRMFAQSFTTRSDGSGHGLHYCANVIREMGGEISAESQGPGFGATFRFTIPRAVRTSVATGTERDTVSENTSEPGSSGLYSTQKVEQYI